MLSKLRKLSWPDRALLAEALLYVCAMRLALWLVPFRRLRATPRVRPRVDAEPARLAWAIAAAARHVPNATCLVRAMAAQRLLASHGHKSDLRIGVAKQSGTFEAHAWVEHKGVAILGAPTPGRYELLNLSLIQEAIR